MNLASTFLGVLLAGSLWRLAWLHGLGSRNPHVRGLARAALTQY